MDTFNQLEKLHNEGSMLPFSNGGKNLLWLLVKAATRSGIIDRLFLEMGLTSKSVGQRKKQIEIFEILSNGNINEAIINLSEFLKKEYFIRSANLDLNKISSELYFLNHFSWGGDQNNSLDKQMVRMFVKTNQILSFERLELEIQNDAMPRVRGYVLNSWYNYWCSVGIEHLFNLCPNVIPATGKIKNVDFFIGGVPFDLKITYYPKEYQKKRIKELQLAEPLKLIKRYAKELGIKTPKSEGDELVGMNLLEQIKDKDKACFSEVMGHITNINNILIEDISNNKPLLLKWLYENQGEMRFGAENRIFIILCKLENFSESWRLKRNFHLVQEKIKIFIDNFKPGNISHLKIDFTFKGKPYSSLTDAIIVTD